MTDDGAPGGHLLGIELEGREDAVHDLDVILRLVEVLLPLLLQVVVLGASQGRLVDEHAAHLRLESLVQQLGQLFPLHVLGSLWAWCEASAATAGRDHSKARPVPGRDGGTSLEWQGANRTMPDPRATITVSEFFRAFAKRMADFMGSAWAFAGAAAIVVVWAAAGHFFHFSDTWQLVINTGTTIVTFLMVFLIQRSQNKDALAIHLKLNEIVAALEGASNRLIDVEDLTEEEIKTLHKHYQRLVEMAKEDFKLTQSHSIEEADARHKVKHSKHHHPAES